MTEPQAHEPHAPEHHAQEHLAHEHHTQEHHTHEPPAVDVRSSKAGLRTVAVFEAGKGALVVILGLVLLVLRSRVQDLAESLLFHLHADFDARFAHMLLNAASQVSYARMTTLVAAIGSYATVRFVEAWGLWHQRIWAEWFALLSGALYLPWELLKLSERVDWERISVLVINVVIVAYMLFIRIREARCPEVEEFHEG